MTVHIARSARPDVLVEDMNDIVDAVMSALHSSFDGRTLDAATLAFTLIATGMGVLRDARFAHVKDRAHDFIDEIDLADIHGFNPMPQ